MVMLSPTLRQAWDGGNLQITTKNSPARASEAHVSLVGHITAPELSRNLTSTEMANGFANRILWAFVERSKSLPDGGKLNWDDLQSILQRIRDAVAFAKNTGKVSRDEEAN